MASSRTNKGLGAFSDDLSVSDGICKDFLKPKKRFTDFQSHSDGGGGSDADAGVREEATLLRREALDGIKGSD